MTDRTRDLVERLRDPDAECRPDATPLQALCDAAAAEIERLAAGLAQARAVLERCYDCAGDEHLQDEIRAALAALEGKHG